MSESPLDQAIDAVAREMTALESPAGMRAEVLARIESTQRPGSARLQGWALAASVAAIVLAVAAAVWFARPAEGPESVTAGLGTRLTPAAGTTQSRQPPSENLASEGLAASATRPGIRPSGTTTSARPPTSSQAVGIAGPAARGTVAAQASETATAAPEMGPAALAPLNPIVIAALGPDAIDIPDIGIEPLDDLKPITIQDIPAGSGEPQRRIER